MPTYLSRASAKQVEANRRNALRSAGPRTDQGRAASAGNSTRHGLCARVVAGVNPALPGEDAEAYLALLAGLRDDLGPTGEMEEVLVDRAAQLTWKLRRVPGAEGEIVRAMTQTRRAAHEKAEQYLPSKKRTAFGAPSAGELLGETLMHDTGGAFERLQVYEQRIERQLHGCLQQLRLLRKMRQDQGESSECNRSAKLGIQELGPRMDTNLHESDSGAQHSGSGVPPVDVSPPSFPLDKNIKERRDEGTGGTPELLFARRNVPIRDDSCEFVDAALSRAREIEVERTNPMSAEPLARPALAAEDDLPGGSREAVDGEAVLHFCPPVRMIERDKVRQSRDTVRQSRDEVW